MPDLQTQLDQLQLSQIVHGRRAIILFEGLEGAGKKHALRQLATALDPCRFVVYPVDGERRLEADGHWLAPFWRALPAAGDTAIFFRSWYRRVLDDCILGRLDNTVLSRSFDEINEFEARQRDYGTLIVKLYFDVSPEGQDARLRARSASPWHSLSSREDSIRAANPAYLSAFEDLKTNTDTRWSPWQVIPADDDEEAAVIALGAVAEAWSKVMPAEPPRLVARPEEEAA